MGKVLKPTVRLIAWTSGGIRDPRRVIVVAIKTSSGGLLRKGLNYYINEYPDEKVSEWLIKAVEFPSVLEHVTFTFLIEGISRVTSHQLVRHRLASYTQESQRYSLAEKGFVVPKTIKEKGLENIYISIIENMYEIYEDFISKGIPYEDARYILPQAVTTKILMTVNLRELIHIACLRTSPKAQWEIREVVSLMVKEASRIIPELPEMIKKGCERGI